MSEDLAVAEDRGTDEPRPRRKNLFFFDRDYRLLDRIASADGLNHSAAVRALIRREGRERWPAEGSVDAGEAVAETG